MSQKAVTKSGPNDISRSNQDGAIVETKEQSASANASAGLNLNLFGAIAGAFSGSETKETDADGKSTTYREGKGNVQGAGEGNFSAVGSAAAEQKARQTRAAIREE